MKLIKGYKKRIIIGLLTLVVLFSGILIFNQWRLLQDLIGEKGSNMYFRYRYQDDYLNTVEEITTEIILTNSVSEETLGDIEELNEVFLQIRILDKYYQPQNFLFGNFTNKIGTYTLDWFIEEINDFFEDLQDNRVKLSDKNLEYLKNINNMAKELNSIKEKYEFNIKKVNGKIFYSESFAKAINEMDDSIDIACLHELEYEEEKREVRKVRKPKLEDVYGEKFFSDEEAMEAAERFIGDFDKVKAKIGEGSSNYDGNRRIGYVEFSTINGYKIEITRQGGKIQEIDNDEWHDMLWENKEDFDESQINISTEDAISGVVEFLLDRGIDSLEVAYVDQLGPELEVGFVPRINGYLNMVAGIFCEVDLTAEGRLIELSLDDYWEGLAYDDSGYEQALKDYDKAKSALDPKIVITDEKLVGRRGEGVSLDFYWRFTTEYDDEYYIYVNTETGKQDVEKVEI